MILKVVAHISAAATAE
ncbi:hypothetical protein A2U01_0092338, partial [Trifolium medium]|nr:hypothetical protein [Trifolium medium]